MLFGLNWRDQLPPVVADELDALITKMSAFMSVAHNEDGTIANIGTKESPPIWTEVVFNAGMFTATDGMAWNVTNAKIHWKVTDEQMTFVFHVPASSTVAPAGLGLQIAIPSGYTVPDQTFGTYLYSDDGGNDTVGQYYVTPGTGMIQFYKILFDVWVVPATLTSIRGQCTFRVTK